MTADLLILAAVLAALAYLATGWHLARKRLPQAWANARDRWTIPEYARSSVRWQTAWMILFWLVLLPCRSLMAHADQVLAAGDPQELERGIRERDRRIAELERETGIRP